MCAAMLLLTPPFLTHLHSPAAPRVPLAEFARQCPVAQMTAAEKKAYARYRKAKSRATRKVAAAAQAQAQAQSQAHAQLHVQSQARRRRGVD